MHTENLLALLHVGQTYIDLTVETTGTHQSLVKYIGTVGCSQHDHTGIGLESIHLGEHLVQRILALVVARKTCILATCTADSVNLVDEYDTWSLLLCLLEQIANTRSTNAYEHLYEVRTRN